MWLPVAPSLTEGIVTHRWEGRTAPYRIPDFSLVENSVRKCGPEKKADFRNSPQHYLQDKVTALKKDTIENTNMFC